MSFALINVVCLAVALRPVAGEGLVPPSTLEAGYRQMYNLDFDGAHKTFHEWQRLHPEDPLGPTSDAAAYLFSELDRLGVLQSQLFVENQAFIKRQKLAPDPAAKQGFQAALAASDALVARALAHDPQDRNALFAQIMNLGLRTDYLALIERRYLTSLGPMKNASALAEKLLALDSSYYDAYLAVGVENYILSLNPAPLRWLLRLYGAHTDKEAGIQKLELTAAKGHLLLPYARLLLAVAALRDNDRARARHLLAGLAQEFPNNTLYRRELARLK